MTNGKFAEGIAIIAKHLDASGYDVAAAHDQVFFGAFDLDMPAEDRARLLELGWFEDEDSWSCFV